MTYKAAGKLAEMEFDGWVTNDAVDLVECETAALEERGELGERGRSPELPGGLDAPETQHQQPQQRERISERLNINETPPGALAKPAVRSREQQVQANAEEQHYEERYQEFEPVNPFVPPVPERPQMVTEVQRFVITRWRQFCKGLPWQLAWLSSLAVGSAALIVSAGRWQQAETVADVGLRNQCVEVTNSPGEVAAAKANGLNIPSGRTFGVSGTCKIRKTDGEVHMVHNGGISEDDIAGGYILACCSNPIGKVSVDV